MSRPVFGETPPERKGSVFKDDSKLDRTITIKRPSRRKTAQARPCCKNCEGLGGHCSRCGFKLHDGQPSGLCGVCHSLSLPPGTPLHPSLDNDTLQRLNNH